MDPQALLAPKKIRELADNVNRGRAARWGGGSGPGDTVWMGVMDGAGRAVSMIQSLYHEFGSGIVLAESGVNWQNRGCSFSLDPKALNALLPGRLPFHTNNPAMARLADGRLMVYGSMGGDGQPQTQAALFTRYARYGQDLQQAVTAPVAVSRTVTVPRAWPAARRRPSGLTAMHLISRGGPNWE